MSVLLQNPNRIFAFFAASDTFNNSVIMEKRHLENIAHFEPREMYELLGKYSLPERVKWVQRMPREGSVVHNNLPFRTNYTESKKPTALFMIDSVIVVFLDKDNPTIKKPMGTVSGHVETQDKIPQLESIRETMRDLCKTRLATLAILFGASIAGTFLVKILSFEDKSMLKVQGVVRVGFAAVAFLAGLRLVQWALFVNKLFSMQSLGSYVAHMRAYAYSYPEIVSEQHCLIRKFLLPTEVTYLQSSPSSVWLRLKNNLLL